VTPGALGSFEETIAIAIKMPNNARAAASQVILLERNQIPRSGTAARDVGSILAVT